MNRNALEEIADQDFLDSLFPPEKSDQFFEALYGDPSEGAYDIQLKFVSASSEKIVLAFSLTQRPGKCLVCSLTYGLPKVFSRHPLIHIDGMVRKLEEAGLSISSWSLGKTEETSATHHLIPFYLNLG